MLLFLLRFSVIIILGELDFIMLSLWEFFNYIIFIILAIFSLGLMLFAK